MKEQTTKSVGAVILSPDQNQLLIIYQREEDYWVFPKGKMIPGETELQTLRREIQEEVSITDFDVLPGFRVPIFFDFQLDEKTLVHRIIVYYLLRAHALSVKLDQREASDYHWCGFDEIKQ